ncbi:apolipoprotein N-acyltransferase [Piscinibacter sakaiensis]|uniref:apolipoprotein N-acyltransferase n=1 Tax=Piscinibacter sakaiensis TaxID=1547922 RepID=UPI00372D754F
MPDFSRPSGPRPLGVALLQGNVPQDEKFAAGPQAAAIEWHVRALLDARGPQTDLVIAPETALVLLPEQMPEGFWAGLQQAFAQGPTHALVGVPWGDEASGYTNSALGLAPGRAAGAPDYRYDKHHLVPFGEFIPAGFRWFTRMMNIPLGDFARGPLVAPSMPVNGERIAPNICYEDLFGEELAARFRDPAQAPTVLANLSNIGWFGDSPALPQHLGISRMRSLELQRPMLRATNTGVTAVIDHRGRVTARLAPFTRGVLRARAVRPRCSALRALSIRTACASGSRPSARSRTQCVSTKVLKLASQMVPTWAPASDRPSRACGWPSISRTVPRWPSL